MRRSPGAWACTTCARSWRRCRSSTSTPRPSRPSPSGWPSFASGHAGTIEQIEETLTARLEEKGIAASVSGRQKKPYSVFNKMQRKALSLEQLSDIFVGFRVIVADEEDCYRTLGIVHRTWPLVPGRFKDYISIPKQNGYRSIHTTIVGPSRQRVELQIRTRSMHHVNEYGIAAHELYKDGQVALSTESEAYSCCAARSRCCPKATRRRSSSRTPSSNCSRTRSSASRRRAA